MSTNADSGAGSNADGPDRTVCQRATDASPAGLHQAAGTLDTIDFAALYREHKRQSGRASKPAAAWDRRAAALRDRPLECAYSRDFIRRMDLRDARTLLDVGCGVGTIGLQLAGTLDAVYGLDYSAGMLDLLRHHANARGLSNVHAVHASWTDDWSHIPRCDVVVASRSTLVDDMEAALIKLNAHARRRVYLSYLVGGAFVDPDIAAVLGREPPIYPDYIYILNILYRMGLHPRLDYIETPGRLAGARSLDDFTNRVAAALGPLDPSQRAGLRQWYKANPERARSGGAPMRWAFISWERSSYG